MLTRFDNPMSYFPALSLMEDFRREVDRLFGDGAPGAFDDVWSPSRRLFSLTGAAGPRMSIADREEEIVLAAEVPGMGEQDVRVTIEDNLIKIEGERKSDRREGYQYHLQERTPMRFSKSYSLPVKIDVEKAEAKIENGVLAVRLPKAAEARPRQIAVKVG